MVAVVLVLAKVAIGFSVVVIVVDDDSYCSSYLY